MIKKELYPKTPRADRHRVWQVAEKIDGSNLLIGKVLYNGVESLFYATRSNIYIDTELESELKSGYEGLTKFHNTHGKHLLGILTLGSVLYCEWTGSNKGYPKEIYLFGKGRLVNEAISSLWQIELDRSRSNYWISQLTYPFQDNQLPDYISTPLYYLEDQYPTVDRLDELYDQYLEFIKVDKERPIEGFVVYDGTLIHKYVRRKRGKLTPHES